MPPRLDETYQIGAPVEIYLEQLDPDAWLPGTVLSFQRPGCWVQTEGGHIWFVTNTRRIRKPTDTP